MALKKCKACAAIFDPEQPDGLRYCHVCPPLAAWEIRDLMDAGQTPLTRAQYDQLVALDNTKPANGVSPASPALGDAYLQSLNLQRPGHRDENLDPAKHAALRDATTGRIPDTTPDYAWMKSPGYGVTAAPVPDAPA